MSTWMWVTYLISLCICSGIFALCMRSADDTTTNGDVAVGLFVTVTPIINTVCIFAFIIVLAVGIVEEWWDSPFKYRRKY